MADEGQQKKGWFARLAEGLTRTSRQMTDQVVSVLTKMQLDEQALATLEDLLIEADLGPEASERIVKAFAEERFGAAETAEQIKGVLARAIADELAGHQGRFDPMRGPKPFVVLFVGVNGSGKTTTLGKIAADLRRRGAKVLIAAGDTFRAAAIEQLQVWGQRAGVPVLAKEQGADAAGLAFEALERARAEGVDVLLIDTAGRLQNKTQLMDELAKIVRVLRKLDPSAPHETLLVLDATVGRNALSQVEVFDRTAGVTGVVMTKLDGTARGGVLVPVAQASHAPIKLVGVGEGLDDLQPFDARAFARGLVGLNPQ
jgi:fused signal recognition particle receptor